MGACPCRLVRRAGELVPALFRLEFVALRQVEDDAGSLLLREDILVRKEKK